MILTQAASFAIVAYSTFMQLAGSRPTIMSIPTDLPPMAGTFVACLLEEMAGQSTPRAAIIFLADMSFDCPQMPRFILRTIDSIDAIRKIARKANMRVVASQVVLKNPDAALDRQNCEDILYWQYLGHSRRHDQRLI